MVKSTDDSNDGSEESKHGKSELILGYVKATKLRSLIFFVPFARIVA